MRITFGNGDDGGEKWILVPCDELSFGRLVRVLRSMEGVVVRRARMNPMNDEASAEILLEGHPLAMDTIFSDAHIHDEAGTCPTNLFLHLAERLATRRVRWWERCF